MTKKFKAKITVFYCINTFGNGGPVPLTDGEECEFRLVKLACSSMVKDVFLLRAFEAGADAVIVLVCPEGQCRYVEGNLRAYKRVMWVKKLLDEIGIDGNRLSLVNLSSEDKEAAAQIVEKVRSDLIERGPSPAR
jgi:coenzyme F420-reducing hydrogenase delta subunit